MSSKVVEAQIFGVVDELTPVTVWRQFGILVEDVVSHLVHEPVEALALQTLLQPTRENSISQCVLSSQANYVKTNIWSMILQNPEALHNTA